MIVLLCQRSGGFASAPYENSYSMKYQCDNCQFCCITPSQNVSYCGLANQCVATPLKQGMALGLSFICLALFAMALLALYLQCRNRRLLERKEQPDPNILQERIDPPCQTTVSKEEKVASPEKKQDRQSSRSRSSRSTKPNKFSKITSPSVKTHTQRRLV